MKTSLLIFLLGSVQALALPAPDSALTGRKPVLVFVHGAWAGGWQAGKVSPLLEALGYKVYRPTLPGMGEHFKTALPDIGLATHIDDIVNLILFEDLHDVMLLGHSYGGMVITGVADRIPERISRLIYLDAFVPRDGESVMTVRRAGTLQIETMITNGFIIPSWVKPGDPLPVDVPQPLKTFTDPIVLKNAATARIPATYILTVERGKIPEDDDFYPSAVRAQSSGWSVLIMEAGHVPQWDLPEATARLLSTIH